MHAQDNYNAMLTKFVYWHVDNSYLYVLVEYPVSDLFPPFAVIVTFSLLERLSTRFWSVAEH